MSQGESNDNGNGKVTLAKIDTKLDEIFRRLNSIDTKIDCFDQRMRIDELAAQNRETRLASVEEDVERLQSKDTWGSITTGFMAVLAGVIGWLK